MAGTVYGMAFIPCTQRVFAVGYELGIDLKLSVLDMMKGEHKQPEHLAKHVCNSNYKLATKS